MIQIIFTILSSSAANKKQQLTFATQSSCSLGSTFPESSSYKSVTTMSLRADRMSLNVQSNKSLYCY